MRISDWSSDVCSSDLLALVVDRRHAHGRDQIVRLATERLRQRPEVGGCWQVYAANIVRDAVSPHVLALAGLLAQKDRRLPRQEIGRAWCRERVGQYVEISVVAVTLKKK